MASYYCTPAYTHDTKVLGDGEALHAERYYRLSDQVAKAVEMKRINVRPAIERQRCRVGVSLDD